MPSGARYELAADIDAASSQRRFGDVKFDVLQCSFVDG